MLEKVKSTLHLDRIGEPWASLVLFGTPLAAWQGWRLYKGKGIGLGDGGYYLEGLGGGGRGRGAQQNRMRYCASQWNASGKRGNHKTFMKKCLSTGGGGGMSGLDGGRPRKKGKKKKSGGKRRQSAAVKAQQSKMRGCAKQWRSSGKRGNYKSFMAKCLKG